MFYCSLCVFLLAKFGVPTLWSFWNRYLNLTYYIMVVCHTCSKRVLSHSLKIACHVCNETYHMKCISLASSDLDYMQTNSHNWMCLQCTSNTFPFNQIEDDNDFVLACHFQPCNELLSSDLIDNPFGSDPEEINNQAEFDFLMKTFIMNKICSMAIPAVIT